MARPLRILILSASIGEGHDLPARALAEAIAAEAPDAETEIIDSLAVVGGFVERTVLGGSQFHSEWGARLFDAEFKLVTDVAPTRWFAGKVMVGLSRGPILRAVQAAAPDVVVSTYPGATEVLGRLRARGRLDTPIVSAITDLAALRYWAHPAVDLHLITHPESEEEVRSIAPDSEIVCVRGLTRPEFYAPRDPAEARRALGLPTEGPVVVVSGGGWAIGDLSGAAEAALAERGTTVVCICGRSEKVLEELTARFADEPRAVVMGFTEEISDLFAAADVLVHSSAGLTVLEALMRGCRVISYGWGHGHIKVNNAAYVRFGLAEVATDHDGLQAALARSLAQAPLPQSDFASLPDAAPEVLRLAGPT